MIWIQPQNTGVYILMLLFPALAFAANVEVHTDLGTVIGTLVNYNGETVRAFLGIPFAEPPIGKLRFQKTVPVSPWFFPVIANSFKPACHQYSPYNLHICENSDNNPCQSEDCLHLNIWTPSDCDTSSKKPVMFWIYAGSFQVGASRIPVYDGSVLAAVGDVIVVTINYRVGVFGFLSSRTSDAPGNAGLYDILEALEWVNRNIAAFGGDDKKITVFGDSAGGVTGGLLCISPLSKNLFQRVIMQSGSPLHFTNDATAKNYENAQKLSEKVGCTSGFLTFKDNPDLVIQCLRNINAWDLQAACSSNNASEILTFSTIVGDEFIPTEPRTAVREGNFRNADVLIGAVQDEGSILSVLSYPQIFGKYGELDPQINKTLGASLIRDFFRKFLDPEPVVKYYLRDVDDNDYFTIRSQVYHSFGDFAIFCPSKFFAEKFSERRNTVYRYYYDHRTRVTPWAPWMNVVHLDDVHFVFGRPLDHEFSYTQDERGLSEEMINLWSNFAKTGTPSWTWPQYSKSFPYIKQFRLSMESPSYLEQHERNCEFFRSYFGY